MRIIISCVLLSSLVLNSCIESPSPVPSLVPTRTSVPSETATSTLNNKTIVLTPDDVFVLPELEIWSTTNSEDFCEHLPLPQIVATPDRVSILSERFVLCIQERTNTAMELDTGSLVSGDDERGDIAMQNAPGGEEANYAVVGMNNAYLSDAYVLEKYANHEGANHLSYAYCENLVRDQVDWGAMVVEEGKIACIRTTEGKIALLRVEKVYPARTLSAEFSFTILRNE